MFSLKAGSIESGSCKHVKPHIRKHTCMCSFLIFKRLSSATTFIYKFLFKARLRAVGLFFSCRASVYLGELVNTNTDKSLNPVSHCSFCPNFMPQRLVFRVFLKTGSLHQLVLQTRLSGFVSVIFKALKWLSIFDGIYCNNVQKLRSNKTYYNHLVSFSRFVLL